MQERNTNIIKSIDALKKLSLASSKIRRDRSISKTLQTVMNFCCYWGRSEIKDEKLDFVCNPFKLLIEKVPDYYQDEFLELNEEELNKLLSGVTIAQGDVLPNIQTKEITDADMALLEECLNEDSPKMEMLQKGAPSFCYERKHVQRFSTDTKKPKLINAKEKEEPKLCHVSEEREPLRNLNEICTLGESDFNSDNLDSLVASNNDENIMDDNEMSVAFTTGEDKEMNSAVIEPEVKRDEAENLKEKPNNLSFVWQNCGVTNEKCSSVDIKIDSSELPLIKNSEGDQVLQLFWLDAHEDYFSHPGTVYIFGKVFVKSANSYASCCLTVKNIERRIFLLPRLKGSLQEKWRNNVQVYHNEYLVKCSTFLQEFRIKT
ncbi:DNA polymerase alpha catalytic subunit [Armadillidium vulgare]|nr:DNA polymerase alpha catalytic subunit [Armadillidium vulgare]